MKAQEQFRYSSIISKINSIINSVFPELILDIKTEGKITIFFCSNKKKYYSNKFQSLILDINQNILWADGIDNVIFVYDTKIKRKKLFQAEIKHEKDYIENRWKTQKIKGLLIKETQVFEQKDSIKALEAA